jgi:LPS O-antigen subunit length determinant protein (WzzB/FepE family)
MIQENKSTPTSEEDSIDIIALLKQLWSARKFIIKTTLVFTLVGLLVAVLSTKQYTSSTTFVPIGQGKSTGGNLGGLASLAGINLGGSNDNGGKISPELYPQIVNSIPFQLELLKTPLKIEGQDTLVSYKEYYTNIYKPGVLSSIKKYTLGLPGVIISSLRGEDSEKSVTKKNKIIHISQEENKLILQLEEQVTLEVNAKEGFVSIATTLSEALASAQLTLKAQELLQEYALNFKTQKSIEQLSYIEERFLEKKKEFDTVKMKLALFQDRNNAINTAVGKTKLLQLQSDYNLSLTVYTELAKQLETQRLQVKKDTPIFTVLKPVTVPTKRSSPKRALILIIYIFLGVILSMGFVLIKEPVLNILREMKSENKSNELEG